MSASLEVRRDVNSELEVEAAGSRQADDKVPKVGTVGNLLVTGKAVSIPRCF